MLRPNFTVLKTFRLGMAYANRQLKDIDISSGLVYFIIELSQVEWLNMSDLSAAVGVDNAYATRAVEKLSAAVDKTIENPFEMANLCFLGSNVESGTGTAVVVLTGSGDKAEWRVSVVEQTNERGHAHRTELEGAR